MPYQNIDVAVTPADVTAVKDAFASVLSKLPFLVNLTSGERQSIVKTGPDSLSFVQNALSAAQSNPGVFPASFDTAGFQRDVNLFALLTELQMLAESVTSQLDDTRLAVGGEAMQGAMQTYNYIKAAAKNTPGLKPVAEQLGERFQKGAVKGTIHAAEPSLKKLNAVITEVVDLRFEMESRNVGGRDLQRCGFELQRWSSELQRWSFEPATMEFRTATVDF